MVDIPQVCKILTHSGAKVVFNTTRRALSRRRILKRESLLPWQLRRESPNEAARIATVLTPLPLSPNLLFKRPLEELAHETVGVRDEPRVHAMVHH